MHPQNKLSAARLWATKKVPYFTAALYSLIYKEVPLGTLPFMGPKPIGTLAMTDGGVLFWEKEAVDRWSVSELGSVLIHELMHFLRRHGARRMQRDPQIWNIANDCEINDDLHEMKLPLPDGGGLKPSDFKLVDGRTAEEYYAELIKDPPPQPPCACGSCAGNGPPGEDKIAEGEPGRSLAEKQVIQIQVANAVQQHIQQHGIGSVPLGIARWAEEMVQPPKVSWREKLQHCARGAVAYSRGATESTYQKISRRQGGLGFGIGRPILTATIGRHPKVYVAIDTSGSMGKDEVDRGVSETIAIIDALGGSVTLLSCDCAVHTTKAVKTISEVLEALKGGGGTDFHPVFKAIEDMEEPDLLVFVTDGGGYAPAVGPEYSVIWLLVGKHRCKPLLRGNQPITWGEMIEIDED